MRAMRSLTPVLLSLVLAACPSPATTPTPGTTEPEPPPGLCGNAVVEEGEDCDDGNLAAADGCTADCTTETGPIENEPNDVWSEANALPKAPVTGHLPEGDVDCFALPVERCGALQARLVAPCPEGVVLAVHDRSGVQVAAGSEGLDGCAVVDPERAVGARWLPEGTAAVCVSALLGQEVPGYSLTAEVTSSEAYRTGFEPDLDGDGEPDLCDPDRDGDGLANEVDNCPDVSNGPKSVAPAPSADGFLRHWLVLAPILGEPTTGGCRPSDTELPGGDAALAPALGDEADGLVWTSFITTGDRLGFLARWGNEAPPREVYVHTYVYSATSRAVTLSVGADDGVRAWLQGTEVMDISGCQGTNIDQFQAPVTLEKGFNRLTLKVRDQGGGWGLFVRFLDGKVPVTDLELSLTPDGPWTTDQSDLDGDGLGDLCDPTPAG